MQEETLKKLHDLLDEGDFNERKGLWDVMTALRGPDFSDPRMKAVKSATTGVIRWRVLGPTGVRYNDEWHEKYGAIYGPDSEESLKVRRRLSDQYGDDLVHFVQHAQHAFLALGLRWGAVNE